MKKLLILTLAALALASCVNRNRQKNKDVKEATKMEQIAPDMHNSRNSIDYAGIYSGTIPCADCPGIKVKVTLDFNGAYAKTMTYLEKPNVFDSKGVYKWDDTGSIITLTNEEGNEMYKVGENKLIMLDRSGNVITGELADLYILTKE